MDRRTLLAISLILIVLILPTVIFPPPPPPVETTELVRTDPAEAPGVDDVTDVLPVAPPVLEEVPTPAAVVPDTLSSQPVVVESGLYRYYFSPRGARLTGAELLEYESFAGGDAGVAQMIPDPSSFLDYRLVFGSDTVLLADWQFEPSAQRVDVGPEGASLTWVARRGGFTVRITYSFRPDEYLFRVHGEYDGISGSSLVLVGLGPRLRSTDSDSIVDFRSFAVVTKNRKTDKVKFTSLDFGERQHLAGPYEWVAIKSKYFLGAILAIDEGQLGFGGVSVTGGPRTTARTKGFLGRIGRRNVSVATQVNTLASLPVPAGSFDFLVYLGPQEYRHLSSIGHDLENVNPYGWILRPIIAPLAILVVRVMLWFHETLNLGYGWVLMLFGVLIRLALWPLNQKAMRSQMAMQALQPEMKALQERHKNDKAKLQQEMMKLYKHHGANPLGGCLPIVVQMPILFTLFFVFLNTIEFRGVPFLWLPDLSLLDPLYIVPILMGGSMFLVSKIGQIGVPPNPQTKMMVYVMPAVLTLMFLQFSSGLNLYYATSNIVSIPQQWFVAQERLRRARKKE